MKHAIAALALGAFVICWQNDGRARTKGALPDENSSSQHSAAASGPLGGYEPVSNVREHARISADVCDINELLDARPVDFAAIARIYSDGRNSTEQNGTKRTLRNFARETRSTEHLLGRYERYLGQGWLDAFTTAAVAGNGAFAGETDLVRRQGIQKGVRDQVLVAWTFHELDAALNKASKGDFAPDTGAPHNWDEARAYYHGERPECAPHATAEERGREFGTASSINNGILVAMQRGLKALQARDTIGATRARDEIVRLVLITYIQSAIKYSAAIDEAIAQGKTEDARVWQSEGWAYFRVIEPLVADGNPGVARAVSGVLNLEAKPAQGSGEKVARAFAEAYDALKIRPAEVGQYRARQ